MKTSTVEIFLQLISMAIVHGLKLSQVLYISLFLRKLISMGAIILDRGLIHLSKEDNEIIYQGIIVSLEKQENLFHIKKAKANNRETLIKPKAIE